MLNLTPFLSGDDPGENPHGRPDDGLWQDLILLPYAQPATDAPPQEEAA